MAHDQRELAVSQDDYELLCSILVLDEESVQVLQRAEPTAEGYRLVRTLEDLEDLQGFVASEANHEADRSRQRRLDRISDVIEGIIRS